MEKIIDSPFTDGKAVLNKKLKKMSFRKEEFEVFDLFYKCENTGEELLQYAIQFQPGSEVS